MSVPQSLLPHASTNLKQFSSTALALQETKSSVASLIGSFLLVTSGSHGDGKAVEVDDIKLVKYQGVPGLTEENSSGMWNREFSYFYSEF